jgi:predicted ester cyclase
MADLFNSSSLPLATLVPILLCKRTGGKMMSIEGNKAIAIDSFRVVESGDAALAEVIVASNFYNREAENDIDNPDRNLPGPAGFLATSRWLRGAFSDLRFEEFEALAEGDRVMVKATMTGCHTGPFQGVAPTGKWIRQRQIHLFRLHEGRLVEHSAQRDDLGLLLQIGWRPQLESATRDG